MTNLKQKYGPWALITGASSLEPETVAQVALASLGKKRVVTPGLLQKLIAFSTRLQPRFLNIMIFGAVVSRAHDSRTRATRKQAAQV